MFPDSVAADIAAAKAVCVRCPSIEPCLQAALDEEGDAAAANRFGIYGGQTKGQRRRAYEQGLTARQVLDRQDADERRKAAGAALDIMRDLYDLYAAPTADGHLIWKGPRPTVDVAGVRVTVGRLAFRVGVGRDPDGQVQRSCGRDLCVLPVHLTDRAMRAAVKAAAGVTAEASP